MSCFRTGGPGKEHGTNKPPPTGRAQERSKSDTTCPTTSQNPSFWHPSWLNKERTTWKDSESEWLAKDNPETNPITIKPETASPVAGIFSWVPLPSCSPPRCPFPIKSLALSADVSPHTIHFQALDKSPVLGPERGPASCNISTPIFLGFPCGSADKESSCNSGDLGSIPGLGRSPGEGKGYPLQYSGLENSMDYIAHGVAKSQTWLTDFHFHLQHFPSFVH